MCWLELLIALTKEALMFRMCQVPAVPVVHGEPCHDGSCQQNQAQSSRSRTQLPKLPPESLLRRGRQTRSQVAGSDWFSPCFGIVFFRDPLVLDSHLFLAGFTPMRGPGIALVMGKIFLLQAKRGSSQRRSFLGFGRLGYLEHGAPCPKLLHVTIGHFGMPPVVLNDCFPMLPRHVLHVGGPLPVDYTMIHRAL